MSRVTCTECNGSGVSMGFGENSYSPCHRCGGSTKSVKGFFGGYQTVERKGSGYIEVSNSPCSACSGRGYTTQRCIRDSYVELVSRGAHPSESWYYDKKCECYSCQGTGRKI